MTDADKKGKANEIRRCLEELSADERELLGKVISAERAKLHMKLPKNIKEDLWRAVAETYK